MTELPEPVPAPMDVRLLVLILLVLAGFAIRKMIRERRR